MSLVFKSVHRQEVKSQVEHTPHTEHPNDPSRQNSGSGKSRRRRSRPHPSSRREHADEREQREHEQSEKNPEWEQTHKRRPRPDKNREQREPAITISLVIPLLNEEGSLRELTARLLAVLEPMTGGRYEILFIDDGSTDSSFEVLSELHQQNRRVKVVRFRRNYGKSAGLAVGFAKARGKYVVTMDADLQDDPAEIPALIAKLNEGYDLVSGWKRKRHDPLEKRLPSKLFNAITSWASGIKLHDFNCGLKAYRSEVVKALNVYGEMHRYLPALAHRLGFRVTEMPVQHHPRKHGVSKFGASRYIKGFLDLMTVMFTTRYVKRPLHLFGTLGTISVLLGFSINFYLTVEWFLGETFLSNRPMTLLGMLLIIVGVQFFSVGLLGELIVKGASQPDEYLISEEL